MSDDLKKRGAPDRALISLSEEWEIRDWCDKFGCSEAELRRAVAKVGHSAKAVEEYLAHQNDDDHEIGKSD
jgi:hypothetical protein